MRIVAISDTHTMERNFQIPDGDVLVHCGDFTYKGRQEEITDFLDWFLDLPHKNKILIAGNHDVTLEKNHREDIVSLLEIEDSEHWIHECFFKRVISCRIEFSHKNPSNASKSGIPQYGI
jgi:predicted phosphodiesterase